MSAPGLIRIFYHNGRLVRNIVQADGLKYDYSFGRPPEDIVEGVIEGVQENDIENEVEVKIKEEMKIESECFQW